MQSRLATFKYTFLILLGITSLVLLIPNKPNTPVNSPLSKVCGLHLESIYLPQDVVLIDEQILRTIHISGHCEHIWNASQVLVAVERHWTLLDWFRGGSIGQNFNVYQFEYSENGEYMNFTDENNSVRLLPKLELVRHGNFLLPMDIKHFLKTWNRSRAIECQKIDMKRGNSSRSFLNLDHTVEGISKFQAELVQLGMYPFLCFGTLLGWYRECGVIPHTEDIDLAVHFEEHNDNLLPHFRNSSLRLIRRLGRPSMAFEISVGHRGTRFDLFYAYANNGTSWMGGTRSTGEIREIIQFNYPNLDQICSTVLRGKLMWVPCNVEEVLQTLYGDWRTDFPTNDWHWYNYGKVIGQYTEQEIKDVIE